MFTKQKCSTKVHVIHDLSHPSHFAINEFIFKHDYTFTYSTIDNVVKSVKTVGPDRIIEYVGIVVNTILKQLCILDERMCDIKDE